MSVPLTPSKRSHDQSPESNGNKFQKTEKQPIEIPSRSSFFRILCPASEIDKIAGNDGDVISQMCDETGAVIRIEEPFDGCDERVISIAETEKKAETCDEQEKKDGESADVTVSHVTEDQKENKENDEDKQSVSVGDLEPGQGVSAVQKALLLVLEKLIENDKDLDKENEEDTKAENVTLRLLVHSSQVGFYLGKSKQMSDESGAEVKVLPRDEAPLCASSSDDLVQSSHCDEGYADGYRDGVVSGKRDGHEVGLKNGFEMGEELGFYQGLVDVWLSAIRVDPSCFSTRVQKSIHQMSQLLQNYPVQDPESDSVDEMKASLRLKLRAVSATLGRSHDQSPESNGNKFQKTEKQPIEIPSRSSFFRILCPASEIDKIAGNDGDVISQMCDETGAVIRIEEPFDGCDERVISIAETEKKAETCDEQEKKDGESADVTVSHVTEDQKENKENDEDKQSVSVGDLEPGQGVSAVQKALLLVLEKLIENDKDLDKENEEDTKAENVTLRLLVHSSQVGFYLGKSKQMSDESGAEVKVLPRDEAPLCASSSDDLVQIIGVPDAVKKAVKLLSDQIIVDTSRDSEPTVASSQSLADHASRSEAQTSHKFPSLSQKFPFHAGSRDADRMPSSMPKFREGFGPNRMNFSPEILPIRLLCPAERVGGLIGKGGAVIKALKHETACDIKVIEDVPDGEDRIIVIAGPVHPDDRVSAVQDAALRVHARISKLAADSIDKTVSAKLLVSSNQIGCLLGKGGAVIAEMRKATGAYIRILGKDQNPECASANEEVVQINGDIEVVQEALLQITTRLRHHFFRENFPSLNLPFDPLFPDSLHAPPFMGRRERSPPGMFRGPSFHHFDSVGGPPNGGFHPRDGHPPYMHDIHRPGMPHMPEGPWGPHALLDGGPDFGGPPRRMSGFGGNQPAIITNTRVEVVVPSSVVPSIYGEGGGCLKQIRLISEAKITINDPKPGVKETTIIISGNPEETHAAQSLIQAFTETPELKFLHGDNTAPH
ncbi:hypothetical protein V2J09_017244 [Rumex salicifolius]